MAGVDKFTKHICVPIINQFYQPLDWKCPQAQWPRFMMESLAAGAGFIGANFAQLGAAIALCAKGSGVLII